MNVININESEKIVNFIYLLLSNVHKFNSAHGFKCAKKLNWNKTQPYRPSATPQPRSIRTLQIMRAYYISIYIEIFLSYDGSQFESKRVFKINFTISITSDTQGRTILVRPYSFETQFFHPFAHNQ